MKSGINSIDNVIDEFPSKGVVAIIGNSEIYQTTLIKTIIRNIGQSFSSGIVVCDSFRQWATREFAQMVPNIGLIDTGRGDLYGTLRDISLSSDVQKYPLIAVDAIEAKTSIIDTIAFKKFIESGKNQLTIVNCNEKSRHHNFDLKSFLVSSALLTMKVEEKKTGNGMMVKISIFGPYLKKSKETYNTDKSTYLKEETPI